MKGFTLIELLVVISILAILGTIGIAGFVNYSRISALNQATFEVATVFNLAKSRARAQAYPAPGSGACSPTDTTTPALAGYKVRFQSDNTYQLIVECESDQIIETYKLAKNNSSNNPIPHFASGDVSKEFLFAVLTGAVSVTPSGEMFVIIEGDGDLSKTITIETNGRIKITDN